MSLMKTAIIDVGGGLRGAYSAGVYDTCLDNGIRFDLCIGVSAGSPNVVSFVAEQRQRSYRFFTDYAFRKEYLSLSLYLKTGSILNLDYAYDVLSQPDGEDPLDYDTFAASASQVLVIAADARTGQPRYFGKEELYPGHFGGLKASCALPFGCKPYKVDGVPYYDGAIGNPVPVKQALELGCDKIVLLLTRPQNVLRKPGRDRLFAALIGIRYPNAAKGLLRRADRYNAGVALARELESQGKALIIAPDDLCGADTLTKDREALERLYQKGLRDGQRIREFIGN